MNFRGAYPSFICKDLLEEAKLIQDLKHLL